MVRIFYWSLSDTPTPSMTWGRKLSGFRSIAFTHCVSNDVSFYCSIRNGLSLEFVLWILQIIGFLHFRLSYIIVEIPLFVLRSKDFEGNNWFLELPVNHLLWVWACFGWLWAVISDVFVYFVFFLILLFYMIEVFVRCWFDLMFWWSCRCQIEYEWHWAPSLINGRNYSC